MLVGVALSLTRSHQTHISCRGWLISILSLFTAGSVGPLDASASLPKSLISSEKDASAETHTATVSVKAVTSKTTIQ